MKLKVKSNSTNTDFVTKKKRLAKKKPQADFRLADSDDFFGFSAESMELSMIEKVIYTIIAIGVAVYILQALNFIF